MEKSPFARRPAGTLLLIGALALLTTGAAPRARAGEAGAAPGYHVHIPEGCRPAPAAEARALEVELERLAPHLPVAVLRRIGLRLFRPVSLPEARLWVAAFEVTGDPHAAPPDALGPVLEQVLAPAGGGALAEAARRPANPATPAFQARGRREADGESREVRLAAVGAPGVLVLVGLDAPVLRLAEVEATWQVLLGSLRVGTDAGPSAAGGPPTALLLGAGALLLLVLGAFLRVRGRRTLGPLVLLRDAPAGLLPPAPILPPAPPATPAAPALPRGVEEAFARLTDTGSAPAPPPLPAPSSPALPAPASVAPPRLAPKPRPAPPVAPRPAAPPRSAPAQPRPAPAPPGPSGPPRIQRNLDFLSGS